MDDLISREAAIEVVEESFECGWYLLETISHIEELPTINAVHRQKYEEDMENAFAHGYTDSESNFRKMIEGGELVEVVRCKDCKECEIEEVSNDYWCKGRKVWEDFYCACGERRTDGR